MRICLEVIAMIYVMGLLFYIIDRFESDVIGRGKVNFKAVVEYEQLEALLGEVFTVNKSTRVDVKSFAALHQLKIFRSDPDQKDRLIYRVNACRWPWQMRHHWLVMLKMWLIFPVMLGLFIFNNLLISQYYVVYFFFEQDILQEIKIENHVTGP